MGEIHSGKYKVIDSNMVILFDENSDLKIVLKPSLTFGFTVVIRLEDSNSQEERSITRTVNDKDQMITIICHGFKEGAGTVSPIELATVGGRRVYIHLWVENMAASTVVNKIEYTVYMEE